MKSSEQPIFPTFICDTGDSVFSIERIETTLYSDHILFKERTNDFESSIPLSKVSNVIYNDCQEEPGLLLFKT